MSDQRVIIEQPEDAATPVDEAELLKLVERPYEEAPEAEQGLPQLNTDTYGSQLFWLFLTFIIMYLLMARKVMPRISDVLEKRHNKLNHDLDQAETLRTEAEKAKVEYEKALQEARSAASNTIAEVQAVLNQEAQERNDKLNETLAQQMREAETRINLTREKAIKKLTPISAEMSRDIVTKLLGNAPDSSRVNTLIEEAYKESA